MSIPEDSAEKKKILDLNEDGRVSLSESLRAEAGLLEEFTKAPARKRGIWAWINRKTGRLLGKFDNDK